MRFGHWILSSQRPIVAINGRGLAVSLYGEKLAKSAEKQKKITKTFSLTKSYLSVIFCKNQTNQGNRP